MKYYYRCLVIYLLTYLLQAFKGEEIVSECVVEPGLYFFFIKFCLIFVSEHRGSLCYPIYFIDSLQASNCILAKKCEQGWETPLWSGCDFLRVFYYTYFPFTVAAKATLYKDNAIKWKMAGFHVLTWKKCYLINMKQKLITLSC